MPPTPVDVFISSTCYDLSDLRQELCQFLQSQGFLVRLSDVPESDFSVDPTVNSIHSCLKNVEACDAVVVVLDHRYGPTLPATMGEYAGISATHAEVRHAVKHKKPVLYFIRDKAFNDFEQLRRDPTFKALWAEPKEPERQKLWLGFVKELSQLPGNVDKSNWLETFKSSVDLKPLVLKRLINRFPTMAGTRAMDGDRLVRVTFTRVLFSVSGTQVFADTTVQNVGLGPAINVTSGGLVAGAQFEAMAIGGLREGENLKFHVEFRDFDESKPSLLYCDYSNRFGDRYRAVIPLVLKSPMNPRLGREQFFVESGIADAKQWIEVV